MYHDIYAVHGAAQAFLIAHIADKIANAGIIEPKNFPHIVLLKLITTINNHFGGVIFIQQDTNKFLPERSCTASD